MIDEPFRAEDYRWAQEQVDAVLNHQAKLGRQRSTGSNDRRRLPRVVGPYLQGPIPMAWLYAAARSQPRNPDGPLLVGIVLWRLYGMRLKRAQQSDAAELPFNVSRVAREWGVSRQALMRSLNALACAGLVRRSGRHGRPSLLRLVMPGQPRS